MSKTSMLAIAALTLALPAVALDLDRCAAAYAAETMRVAEQVCPLEITMRGLEMIVYANKVSDEACKLAAEQMVVQRRKELSSDWCTNAMLFLNLDGKPPALVQRNKNRPR